MLRQALRANGGAQRQDAEQSGWETQCVLLLWLAQLVLIPFDLALVDSSVSGTLTAGCAPGPCAASPCAIAVIRPGLLLC